MEQKQKSPIMRIWELGASHHKQLRCSIILSVIGVAIGLIPYYCAAKIIELLIGGTASVESVFPYLIAALICSILKTLFTVASTALSHKATFSILAETRSKCLKKLSRLSMGTLQEQSTGRWKTILVDQIESIETTLAHVFPEVSGNIAAPVVLIAALFFVDWRLALLSLAVIPIGMFIMFGMMKSYAENYAISIRTSKEMNDAILEYIGGIKVIKAFNQGDKSYARYADSINANASFYYGWMKRCMISSSASKNIAPAVLLTVLPFGLLFFIGGSLTAVQFMTTILLSMSIVGPILKVVNYTDTLATAGTVIESVETILNAPEQNHPEEETSISDMTIKMENVCFSYNQTSGEVLKGVNLTIKPNSKTALVGPSGSGKSTIAKLIAAFWDVSEGQITFGGKNLNSISLSQISDCISYVAQDNFLFDDTVRNNIRMGRENATDKDVEDIAKEAGCHDFIMRLDNGYDTVVGGGGAHLSGGERQRIAIARAMLKNAPIVILDEATAYIDPENEAVVQEAIGRLVKGKTLIVIAHRLSTVTDSDMIAVINDGMVDSVGTHEELLQKSELYSQMWNAHIDVKEVVEND